MSVPSPDSPLSGRVAVSAIQPVAGPVMENGFL